MIRYEVKQTNEGSTNPAEYGCFDVLRDTWVYVRFGRRMPIWSRDKKRVEDSVAWLNEQDQKASV